MIDREARAEAFKALRRFIECQSTSDEYEDEYPLPDVSGRRRSPDPAIQAIYEFSWSWFDDFYPHKLDGPHSLPEDTRQVAERCLLFLRSDVAYEWKQVRFIAAGAVLSNLITLGMMGRRLAIEDQLAAHLDQPEGDAALWPFFRRSDYEHETTRTVERQ